MEIDEIIAEEIQLHTAEVMAEGFSNGDHIVNRPRLLLRIARRVRVETLEECRDIVDAYGDHYKCPSEDAKHLWSAYDKIVNLITTTEQEAQG